MSERRRVLLKNEVKSKPVLVEFQSGYVAYESNRLPQSFSNPNAYRASAARAYFYILSKCAYTLKAGRSYKVDINYSSTSDSRFPVALRIVTSTSELATPWHSTNGVEKYSGNTATINVEEDTYLYVGIEKGAGAATWRYGDVYVTDLGKVSKNRVY